jgi:hypothetical protein
MHIEHTLETHYDLILTWSEDTNGALAVDRFYDPKMHFFIGFNASKCTMEIESIRIKDSADGGLIHKIYEVSEEAHYTLSLGLNSTITLKDAYKILGLAYEKHLDVTTTIFMNENEEISND